MQTLRYFKAKDKKVIEVIVNSSPKNKTAVLVVYGLSGSPDQSMFHNAAVLFPNKGVDVWRIRLFGWHKGARTMLNVTWEQMMADIHQVIGEMAKEYKNVAVIGHSMGGCQVAYLDHPVVKVKVLWDPASVRDKKEYEASQKIYKKCFYSNSLNPHYLTLNWGAIHMCPKALFAASDKYEWYANNPDALPKNSYALMVIRASMNEMYGWPQDILPAKLVVVPDSDHCFTRADGQNQKDLFRHTLSFIKKHAQ